VQWLDVVERLAPTHRVAALDLPGQPGLSAPLRIPRAHDSYVVVLDEVLAGLGARAEVVVGHSLGARAALAAAARGVAIDRLVLVNPAGLARLRVGVRAMSASLGWLARPDDVHARVLLQRMTAPDFALHPDLVQWMATVGAHVRTTLAPPRLPARQRRAVRVPVAVVLGAHDPFISPGRVRRGARHLASATVEVVGDAGHLVPLERPDVVVDAVRSGV
jgi:pimeloyl-ACP methyl ester carboxylesterase